MKSLVLVFAALTPLALADQRGDTPGTQPSTPQEQLGKFHVPPGFEVQLVAAEPDIQKPINFNFDAAGRLWVTGSELYPWPASTDPNGQPIPDFDKGWKGLVDGFRVGDAAPPPSPVGKDTVRILSDFDATGRARKITVFADQLNIPSGIQPLPRKPGAKGDSAIVYSIPNIWLMTDWDGDGFAEKREPLYTGFGYTDTHGGSSSYIYWIDGWIYGTHGFRNHSEVRDRNGKVTVLDSGNTYRFRPDGTAFEIYAHGQTNPFGLAFDPLGNLYSADSHSKPVYMLLRGGYYEGIGKQHDGIGFAPRITDDDHGSSAIGGIIYYADDKWPEEYRGNLFNGNPVTQKINRDRLEWHGSTPKAIRMPDFLTCDDPWFRPVFLKLGPDGSLYIADFYNPIIGHYEVPLTHPARDHTHGRIWRVVWRGNVSGDGKQAAAGALQRPSEVLQSPFEEPQTGSKSLQWRMGALQSSRVPLQSTPGLPQLRNAVLQSSRAPLQSAPGLPQSTSVVLQSREGVLQSRNGVLQLRTDILQLRTGLSQLRWDGQQSASGELQLVAETARTASRTGETSFDLAQKGQETPKPGASAPPDNKSGVAKPVAAEKLGRPIEMPDLSHLDAPALIEKLADPSLEVRRLATNELVDRVGKDAIPAIQKVGSGLFSQPFFERTTEIERMGYQGAALLSVIDRLRRVINTSDEEQGRLLGFITDAEVAIQQVALQIEVLRGWANLTRTERIWNLTEFHIALESHSNAAFERRGAAQAISSSVQELLHSEETPAGPIPRWQTFDNQGNKVLESDEQHKARIDKAIESGVSQVPECLRPLLICWDYTPPDDTELIHSVRIALRDCLLVAGTYSTAATIAAINPQAAEHLADVSLGAPTPESAAFLLAHLERTKLETPRAGEYLKHVVLYLSGERRGGVAKMVALVRTAPLPQRLTLAVNLMEAERQRGIELEEDVTAWKWDAISEALASNNDPLTKLAISAVRDFGTEDELAPLAKIARDELRDVALRLAALEAAANLPASHDLLTATFADPRHLILRKRAAELLAQNGDTATVLAALPQAPWELALAIAAALAKSDDGATALLDAIEAGQAPVRLLVNKAVAGSFFSRPKALQDRAKVLAKDVPPEDARLDKVIAARAAAFRDSPREVTALEKGAQVFQQNCAVCHRFRNAGGNVGPNLDGVVARGPQRLIEDILDPNRNVDPGFRQTIIETRNGQMLAGTNVREQADAVLLVDATGKELNVPKAEIKTRTQTQLSLMPPAFETTLALTDLNNLLAYLLSGAK